jgi:hypothetical protein
LKDIFGVDVNRHLQRAIFNRWSHMTIPVPLVPPVATRAGGRFQQQFALTVSTAIRAERLLAESTDEVSRH